MIRSARCLFEIAVVTLAMAGCAAPSPPSPESDDPAGAATPAAVGTVGGEPASDLAASPYDALPPPLRSLLERPFTGDFDEMVGRRLIRAGVVFNRTQYFIDRGVQRGISYESISLFEAEINKRLKTGPLKVHVAIVPMSRDQLFPALREGKVDLVAAALTMTPERQRLADFTIPTRSGVSEIVVTGPRGPRLTTLDDLSGREVFVRRSSSYHESLLRLNESLVQRGKAPVAIREAPEPLEDDDLLEMVNAGLVELTVVDDFVAEFWRQVFPNIHLHETIAVRTGGDIAIGVRKDNPRLREVLNAWIREYGPRTAFGNTMQRRYLENTTYVSSATDAAERRKLEQLVKLFETYGSRYDVDYLLMAAQGYQESRLDNSVRSRVGAIGVMQVMPATGKELGVGDIRQIEPNVHAGVKYFRFMMDRYYKDEPMDDLNKGLMTLASYNAGPARIRQLREEAARRGLDPHVWFGNVERVASERIGRETVQYVSNIYKYYVAYRLVLARGAAREQAKDDLTSP